MKKAKLSVLTFAAVILLPFIIATPARADAVNYVTGDTAVALNITGLALDGHNWTVSWALDTPDSNTQQIYKDGYLNELGKDIAADLNASTAIGVYVPTLKYPGGGFVLDDPADTTGPEVGGPVTQNQTGIQGKWTYSTTTTAYNTATVQLTDEGSCSPVPEPSTLILLCIGSICLIGLRRKFTGQIHVA